MLSTLPLEAFAGKWASSKKDSAPFIQYTDINHFKNHMTVLSIQDDGKYTIERIPLNKESEKVESIEDGKLSAEIIYYMMKLIEECGFFTLDDWDIERVNATDQSQIKFTISIGMEKNTLYYESAATLRPERLAELQYLIQKIIWSDYYDYLREEENGE
jgi:hypothetical protein